MSDIDIRKAMRSDIPAIVAMLADDRLGTARETVSDPLPDGYYAAFEVIDADPNQLLAVMTEDGRAVGTLQLTFIRGISQDGALRGQIEAVRVDSSKRGLGLGQRLMDWAVEECRRRGCLLAQLTTNKSRGDAHRFYDRVGFEQTHFGYKMYLSEAS